MNRLPAEMLDALFVAPADLDERLAALHPAGATPIIMPLTGEDPVGGITTLLEGL